MNGAVWIGWAIRRIRQLNSVIQACHSNFAEKISVGQVTKILFETMINYICLLWLAGKH